MNFAFVIQHVLSNIVTCVGHPDFPLFQTLVEDHIYISDGVDDQGLKNQFQEGLPFRSNDLSHNFSEDEVNRVTNVYVLA